ncbi:hypothetical protein [Pseudonocardia kunmingensis]|uniref:hypothetical protein n=1 Tax=Pseudonocardia kunmingensis TaxID=630975 RepID=UPI001152E905|nr:hypothetical protein [Pseudonocardia kunmingensis]
MLEGRFPGRCVVRTADLDETHAEVCVVFLLHRIEVLERVTELDALLDALRLSAVTAGHLRYEPEIRGRSWRSCWGTAARRRHDSEELRCGGATPRPRVVRQAAELIEDRPGAPLDGGRGGALVGPGTPASSRQRNSIISAEVPRRL